MIGPVYFVTDPDAPLSVVDQALQAVQGGARTVQLRDKTATDSELLAQARALRRALGEKVQLCVNDRVEVAIEAGLWGLHIGQSDGDPVAIRARIGHDMVLGLSVETQAHARDAPAGVVSYLGVGPIRATRTKPDHAPPLGFGGLARVVAQTTLPCIAIGGLGIGDCAEVKRTGAAGVAVVSAISRADDPAEAARALRQEWEAK